MSWPDIIILVIIAISAIVSLFRGFVREVLSLVAWVVAFWIAFQFTSRVSPLLENYLSMPSARAVVAFLILLVGSLILIGMVNFLIGKLIDKTGLTGTDRVLGMLFGIVRGIAVVAILVFLAGATPVPRDPWWKESMFIGHFETLAQYSLQFLPDNLAKHFSYS